MKDLSLTVLVIWSLYEVSEISVSGSWVHQGTDSALASVPLWLYPFSLFSDVRAASVSGSCPSWCFLSYVVGLLPLALPFRQRFVSASLLCCTVALTSEVLNWDFPFHPNKDGCMPWRGLTIQSPARGIHFWGVVIKTQVSSEVGFFYSSIYCDCSATNILPCSISLELSFWTIQYSACSSSKEWKLISVLTKSISSPHHNMP